MRSSPISVIALAVIMVPAAAQSYQLSHDPASYSGKQSPWTAEQTFIINMYLIIDNPMALSYKL